MLGVQCASSASEKSLKEEIVPLGGGNYPRNRGGGQAAVFRIRQFPSWCVKGIGGCFHQVSGSGDGIL
jgi:hypothetical protein